MKIPKHVAIIMDGNGRWAQRRGYPRHFGHIRGSSRVKAIVREADRLGIKALTLYAFSTENWSRPDEELSILWRLLKKYFTREVEQLDRENVRLHVIGEVERLDPEVRAVVDRAVDRLKVNTGLQLTFALSYGSRRELTLATQKFAEDCLAGKRKPEELTEKLLGEYLWTSRLGELAPVDLVIRTSGEKRVSNFLLWQAAYGEFYFSEVCWPEFTSKHLEEAVSDFGMRERRFGGVTPQSLITQLDLGHLDQKNQQSNI